MNKICIDVFRMALVSPPVRQHLCQYKSGRVDVAFKCNVQNEVTVLWGRPAESKSISGQIGTRLGNLMLCLQIGG